MTALWLKIRRRLRPSAPATCAEVARILQPFLDGETDDHTRRLVRAHLDDCRDCGLEAETYREIKESLRECNTPPPEALDRLRSFADGLSAGSGTGASPT